MRSLPNQPIWYLFWVFWCTFWALIAARLAWDEVPLIMYGFRHVVSATMMILALVALCIGVALNARCWLESSRKRR